MIWCSMCYDDHFEEGPLVWQIRIGSLLILRRNPLLFAWYGHGHGYRHGCWNAVWSTFLAAKRDDMQGMTCLLAAAISPNIYQHCSYHVWRHYGNQAGACTCTMDDPCLMKRHNHGPRACQLPFSNAKLALVAPANRWHENCMPF